MHAQPLATPYVRLPGVDQEQADALRGALDETKRRRALGLLSLVRTGRHIYRGTVPATTIARRRAANKRARIARRATR